MTGHGEKFSRKQEDAIAALLTSRNLEKAAKLISVAPRTLMRWLKVPEFEAAYRDARRATFSQAIARLQYASTAAVSTLLKVMLDPQSPASCRVRAADSVLDHALRAIEIEDVEARVTAIEQSLKEKSGSDAG